MTLTPFSTFSKWLVVLGVVFLMLLGLDAFLPPRRWDGFAEAQVGEEERLRVEERDRNNDGKVDGWIYYRGDQLRRDQISKKEFDTNFDGKVDWCEEFEQGRPVKRLKDGNRDGRWDTWIYLDEEGRPIRRELDLDFDGKVDKVEVR